MKMGGSLFWGILLIIIGLCLVVKIIFHIDISIVKVVVAFCFIYLGIKILLGNWGTLLFHSGPNDIVFGKAKFIHQQTVPGEQNILFGSGSIDFRKISTNTLTAKTEINVVFGGCEILLRQDIPVKIEMDAAFAKVSLPNNNTSVLGSVFYKSPNFDETRPHLIIRIHTVFAGTTIKAE
jgi:hypothetical protein